MDDTLYDESMYVKSSFKSVSAYLSSKYSISEAIIFNDLIEALNVMGRGDIFDAVLNKYNKYTKKEVLNCLSVYRQNIPDIQFYKEAKIALNKLAKFSKYVVSDGNKIVQSIKADALDLNKYFKKVILTHYYGIRHAKPSTYCFKKIKDIEHCNWNQMVYIGDDPNKDFVNLNPLGVKTIRVNTGRFKNQKAKDGYAANIQINDLSQLHIVLGI